MFFVASKVLGFVLAPSNIIVLVGFIGLALLVVRWRRSGIACIAGALSALAIFGWSPASYWLLLPLTERFPAWQGTAAPDVIVVLGGGIESDESLARGQLEINSAGDRVIAMLQLARRFPQARIVYSGGSGALLGDSAAEAPVAARLLDEFGLGNGRVLVEGDSRTTAENAAYTRSILAGGSGKRILLVTSAWHMPRSVGLYRKAGLDVEAYPVDFRSVGWADKTTTFDRISLGLARTDAAVHEWIGLLAARLSGKSDELFPAPR